MSSNPSERVAVVGVIDPDANTAGALVSDYGDASKFNSFMAIGFAGVMGASAAIDMKLTQATSSAGAGAGAGGGTSASWALTTSIVVGVTLTGLSAGLSA